MYMLSQIKLPNTTVQEYYVTIYYEFNLFEVLLMSKCYDNTPFGHGPKSQILYSVVLPTHISPPLIGSIQVLVLVLIPGSPHVMLQGVQANHTVHLP